MSVRGEAYQRKELFRVLPDHDSQVFVVVDEILHLHSQEELVPADVGLQLVSIHKGYYNQEWGRKKESFE